MGSRDLNTFLRPEVRAFAEAMERKLRANDWKGGWKNDYASSLFIRVIEELIELVPLVIDDDEKAVIVLLEAVADRLEHTSSREGSPRRVLGEAADVANMIMMVADVRGALPVLP